MKKLLFITYSLSHVGGVQSVLVNLMNELCEEQEVTVLCLNIHDKLIYDLDPRIKVEKVNSWNTRSYEIMKLMDKYLTNIPKRVNIKSYIYQYGVYSLLKKWFNHHHQNYDCIISTWYMLSSMISIMKKEISKKTIAWEHTNYKVGGYLFYSTLRPYYKRLKSVVYINNEAEEHYKNINFNSFLIRNIVGEPFESTKHIGLGEKENVILFVGRFDPEKNTKEVVSIFSELKNTKQWKLCLIGEGIDKAHIEKYIRDTNISNISLVGRKQKEEVYHYMKKSKILVLTSEKEGLPTVLIEAMFCSNVLISYDCEYGPANIINENNGYLIKLYDKESFKEKIQALIDQEKLLEDLNKSAYQESQKWKKENVIYQWTKLFQ